MKSPLKILFIEDNPKHLADLEQMLGVELPRQPVEITPLYAHNLVEATHLLEEADAVMTDLFFPFSTGNNQEEASLGKLIVEHCLAEGKPVVWITSTYHHGLKTNELNDWGCEHGLKLFDCQGQGTSCENDAEGEHKPWKSALFGLLYTITAVEIGIAIFKDCCIVQSHNGIGLQHRMYEINYYLKEGGGDISKEPVLAKMKEEGFPLD
jgi:hypothetical protein